MPGKIRDIYKVFWSLPGISYSVHLHRSNIWQLCKANLSFNQWIFKPSERMIDYINFNSFNISNGGFCRN